MTVLRVALAQLNPTVGDLDGNLAQLVDAYDRADAAGCDIVAFPELSITGYPPEDLVMKPGFVADNEAALGKLAARTRHCAAVVGFVDEDRDLFNAAAVCAGGEVARHVPQAAAAELRRLRRGPLLHARQRDRPARAVRHRRRQGRHQHLRGRLEPRRPARRAGRRRRRAGDQHQRLAVPPRQGRLPRADAGHPGRRRPLGARLRQPGRRPGRARLRRLLAGVRRRGQPARPRAAVPRGADDRRRPGARRVPPAAARPAWARSRSVRCRRSSSPRRRCATTTPIDNDARRRCSTRTPSCTRRSCSAPATTAPRTASPTS